MTLASDLLDQAQHLALVDPGRPRQASLRRAVSTAYYSLFHLIVDDAVRYLVPTASLRAAVAPDLRAQGRQERGANHQRDPARQRAVARESRERCSHNARVFMLAAGGLLVKR